MALREETDGRQSRSVPFDRAADYYDATRGFPPGIEDAVADAIVATGRLQPTSRVLEIGVGTGRIALPLARRVGSVLGVDLSAPMLAKLLEKRGSLPVAPARADATQLPYADDSVDAAVAVHVFHLIPGWRTVLHELARVLRPGGRLLHGFDDPARGAAWTRWRERADRQLGVENVGVPRAQIESFLEDEGWRPVDAERIGFERRMRPSALIDLIASRTWSVTWRMTDAQLAEATDALRADLSAEFDDLDREVTLESGFWVRAYRPPVR
ncbi:methyltransferase domain-containing protein [Myxococcota bacterium]|nr:methyltransferase domain-containing protein [Myxococcota bacterium]